MRSTATGRCTSSDAVLSEAALRVLWRTQQFSHTELRTLEGSAVTVFSPGIQNNDGGPDFRGARIQIGPTTYVGDVELHILPRYWFSHRHHNDPHYNGVILHVVLDADHSIAATQTACRRNVPVLALRPYLDPAVMHTLRQFPQDARRVETADVPCSPRTDRIPPQTISEWMLKLALRRINAAVDRSQDRLYHLINTDERNVTREPIHRYLGRPDDIPTPNRAYDRHVLSHPAYWNQLLYEALMEGLGFTKNRNPFRQLAENVPLHVLRSYLLTDLDTQLALLLGAAGLLPSSRGLPDPLSRKEVRKLRRRWNELRRTLHRPALHEADWLFFRLRPANFPTARIATICHLLPALFGPGRGFSMILQCVRGQTSSPAALLKQLHDRLHLEPGGFWKTHTHFRGRHAVRGIALGTTRRNEIIVNGIVPLLLLWSRLFADDELAHVTMTMVKIIPASQSRTVRTMKELLVRERFPIRSAFIEQGVLECYSRYCMAGRCEECAVGVAGKSLGLVSHLAVP